MKNEFQISHTKEKYTKPVYFHSHDFYEIYFFVDGNIATRVISYLNRSITDAPSLDELSAHFYVSKYYLSHQFKEYTKIAQ